MKFYFRLIELAILSTKKMLAKPKYKTYLIILYLKQQEVLT